MKNYIDEAGTFGWTPPETSVFCGLSIADRSLAKISSDFGEWARFIADVSSGNEVKGAALKEDQLVAFVKLVVTPNRDFHVAVTGVDTRETNEEVARQWIDDAAKVSEAASWFEEARSNETAAIRFRALSQWLRRRSPQNGLWMLALAQCIIRTIQQTIVRHMDAEDDLEFEEWDILVDRSFIHTARHESFWKAWLQSVLIQVTTGHPIDVPDTWLERNHPHL